VTVSVPLEALGAPSLTASAATSSAPSRLVSGIVSAAFRHEFSAPGGRRRSLMDLVNVSSSIQDESATDIAHLGWKLQVRRRSDSTHPTLGGEGRTRFATAVRDFLQDAGSYAVNTTDVIVARDERNTSTMRGTLR